MLYFDYNFSNNINLNSNKYNDNNDNNDNIDNIDNTDNPENIDNTDNIDNRYNYPSNRTDIVYRLSTYLWMFIVFHFILLTLF